MRRMRRSYSVEELFRRCVGCGGVTPLRSYSVDSGDAEELLRRCVGCGGVTPLRSYSVDAGSYSVNVEE